LKVSINKAEGWESDSPKTKEVAMKMALRHEIVHSFINESGLMDNALMPTKSMAEE
jgi:hypothetical protein